MSSVYLFAGQDSLLMSKEEIRDYYALEKLKYSLENVQGKYRWTLLTISTLHDSKDLSNDEFKKRVQDELNRSRRYLNKIEELEELINKILERGLVKVDEQ